MATTPKKLFMGNVSTTSVTAYTVPASTTTIVKSIVLTNDATTDSGKFTLQITSADGGISTPITATPITTSNTIIMDLSLVMVAGEKISAITASGTIRVHISGVEVTA